MDREWERRLDGQGIELLLQWEKGSSQKNNGLVLRLMKMECQILFLLTSCNAKQISCIELMQKAYSCELLMNRKITKVYKNLMKLEVRWLITMAMVDTCVLCESSGNLVAIWAKDLPNGAVEHIVHQVDLPAGTKQLLCLRFLLRQHKGQEQSDKNAGLHGFCLPGFFQSIRCLPRFCCATPCSQSESGISPLAPAVLYPSTQQAAITCNHASLSLVPHWTEG